MSSDAVNAGDREALREISSKTYKEQAQWFMNAYWDKNDAKSPLLPFSAHPESCERVWEMCHACVKLDVQKGEGGCDLEMIHGNRLQEILKKPITRLDLKKVLSDIDVDQNGKVSLMELMIFNFATAKDINWLVNAPQMTGALQKQIMEAERKVAAAHAAIEESKRREDESKQAFALQKQAEDELKKALAEIKKEEEAYEAEKSSLTATSEDESLGIVKRQKAKNLLLQLLAGDSAPLLQAKITLEAAIRKQEKATRVAAEAKERAERARRLSEQAFQEAEESLNELKNKKGAGQGMLWWMTRELEEAKRYMSRGQMEKAQREHEKKKAALENEIFG